MGSNLGCFAWGEDGDWEAICLDLDIAVQGESFEEVKSLLNEAIGSYLDVVKQVSPKEAKRLLNRRAPLLTQLRVKIPFWTHRMLRDNREGSPGRHGYQFNCPA